MLVSGSWGYSIYVLRTSKSALPTFDLAMFFHLASRITDEKGRKDANETQDAGCRLKRPIRGKLGGGNSNIFYFHPYRGKWSNLTNIFGMGWNHQPVKSLSI